MTGGYRPSATHQPTPWFFSRALPCQPSPPARYPSLFSSGSVASCVAAAGGGKGSSLPGLDPWHWEPMQKYQCKNIVGVVVVVVGH